MKSGRLSLFNMMISGFPNTLCGRRGRDEEIHKICESIRAAGRAGLPVIQYNVYAHRAVEGYYEEVGRAGAGLLAGVCVWLLYYSVYRASGSLTAGAIAGLLLAVNPGFMLTSRLGRMDVFSICFLLAGLLCVTEFCVTNSGQAYIRYLMPGGWLMGIATLMHLNSIAFVVATVILLFTLAGPSFSRRVLYVFTFGLPALLPLTAWLIFALIHGHEAFESQFVNTALNRSAAHIGLLSRIPAELMRQVQSYSRTPLFPLCFLAGSVWLFRQSSATTKMIRPLKMLVATTYLFNTFAMGKVSGFYQLYPNITSTAAAGIMIGVLIRQGTQRTRWFLKIALVLLVLNRVILRPEVTCLALSTANA
ncbi:MAG: ArnT family glycosyltransferase [Bryobacteraceae bacterium]